MEVYKSLWYDLKSDVSKKLALAKELSLTEELNAMRIVMHSMEVLEKNYSLKGKLYEKQ